MPTARATVRRTGPVAALLIPVLPLNSTTVSFLEYTNDYKGARRMLYKYVPSGESSGIDSLQKPKQCTNNVLYCTFLCAEDFVILRVIHSSNF